MQSRRQAIEQGKAELTMLSQQLQECDYDLSLRDLVVSKEEGLGLPVEPRPVSKPLDLKKPAPLEQQNRKNPTSKSHQVPPRKSSFKQLQQQQQRRLVVVRPILPVFNGTIDRCSRCSSHVIFFKTKCLACSRVIVEENFVLMPGGNSWQGSVVDVAVLLAIQRWKASTSRRNAPSKDKVEACLVKLTE